MPIRSLVFDVGGVLLNTNDWSGHRKWEAYFGLPEGELVKIVFGLEAANYATLGYITEAELWLNVASLFGLNTEQLIELQRDFWAGDRLNMELIQFIRDLRLQYKTAILSNAWSGAHETFTGLFRLHEEVDLMFISSEIGVAKPDVRAFQVVTERLGVQPEEALMVDDIMRNVQGAQAAGMWGVHFITTAQVITEIKKLTQSLC